MRRDSLVTHGLHTQQEAKMVGPFRTQEQAARVHDVSVLKLQSWDAKMDESVLNFNVKDYDPEDMDAVRDLSPSQFLLMLNKYSSTCNVTPSGSR